MTIAENLRNPKWSFADKTAAAIVLFSFLMTGLWFTVTTATFINSISFTVQGSLVRYVRETPWGDVSGEWQAEITLIDADDFTCQSGPWQVTTYQELAGNTVTYNLGIWADECLKAGPPYYMTVTRRALLFGVLPLRQSVQTVEVVGERDLEIGYVAIKPKSEQ